MKFKQKIFVFLLLLFIGCQSQSIEYAIAPEFDTQEALEKYDTQNMFCLPGIIMCEYNEVYYGKAHNSQYIMYMDKTSGISGVVCGKPECSHDNKNCNGFSTIGGIGLTVYEEKLYWVGTDYNQAGSVDQYLWCMNLDGTERERIRLLSPCAVDTNVLYQLHRGYLYTAGTSYEVDSAQAGNHLLITAEKMDSEEKIVIMDEMFYDHSIYCRIQLVGNELYIMLTKAENSEAVIEVEVYSWNLKSRQLREIASMESDSIVAWGMWVNPEGEIYLGANTPTAALYVLNEETGTFQQCVSFTEGYYFDGIGDGIIASAKYDSENDLHELWIKDFRGETLMHEKMSFLAQGNNIYFGRIFSGGDQESIIYGFVREDNSMTFFEIPLIGGNPEVIWDYSVLDTSYS